MKKIPYSDAELKVLAELPSPWPGDPPIRVYDRPISNGENMRLLYEEKAPLWMPNFDECGEMFCPDVIPDNRARGFIIGDESIDNDTEAGGPDMFGIEWEYVPSAGGSMVRPGKPALEDANGWKEVIRFPDIDKWDWEGAYEKNKNYLSRPAWFSFWLLSGAWFERLVSFMDFQGAVMALIDEDQQDAVKELFEATTDLMCRIVDKVCEYFPMVQCFCVHDDWGSQAQPFFSQETAMEMIVPYMKKLVDHIHSKGKYADLHSCGHIEKRIECFIAAGWDSWTPQPMNDSLKLYEEYGDKIILGAAVGEIGPDTPIEEQKEIARRNVEAFCKPGKPATLGYLFGSYEFNEEIYKLSRLAYLGETV